VHAHRGGTGRLERAGELDGVDALGAPAGSELGAHGDIDRRGDSAHHLRGQFRRAHERTALALGDDFGHRTAHVDVDERHVVAILTHDARRLRRHQLGFRAKELDDARGFLGRKGQERAGDAGVRVVV
jgi:hypothetical protein